MANNREALKIGALGALLFPAIWAARGRLEIAKDYVLVNVMKRRHTVADRVGQYGFAVRERLEPAFARSAIAYPPASLVIVVLKQEKRLELYAGDGGAFKLIKSYPILAASGELGPKLKEGDSQVPEGIYRIESLNPNSLYHLALRVNYPNEFDREQARAEGRTRLGGDIMIHGNRVSIGCVAIGDEAAEELFVLAAKAGLVNIRAIFSPVDFRRTSAPPVEGLPAWTARLYAGIRAELMRLPSKPS